MSGISYARPSMITVGGAEPPDTMFVGNFCIGSPWEIPRDRNPSKFQHPAAGRVPLVPVRHKPCRPSNFQAQWLNSKLGSKLPISSIDSENDLAAMVHEFIEGSDGYESSDRESPTYSAFNLFFENLKALVNSTTFSELELRSNVIRTLFSISEDRIVCHEGNSCNGRCIRSILVKRLRAAGYDAGICISKWSSAGMLPGGEYEYIDVVNVGLANYRYIVDCDFQSHFEIARPVPNYVSTLKLLPTVYIGPTKKLRKILEAMSDAAKSSLKQNSMHVPPWRTLDYMKAKWFSPSQRLTSIPTATDTHAVGVGTVEDLTTAAVGKQPPPTRRMVRSASRSTSNSELRMVTGTTTKTGPAGGVTVTAVPSGGLKATKTAARPHRMDAVARLQQDLNGCSLQLKRIKACLLVEDKRDIPSS